MPPIPEISMSSKVKKIRAFFYLKERKSGSGEKTHLSRLIDYLLHSESENNNCEQKEIHNKVEETKMEKNLTYWFIVW